MQEFMSHAAFIDPSVVLQGESMFWATVHFVLQWFGLSIG